MSEPLKPRIDFDGPLEAATAEVELMVRAGLAWRHRHRHRHHSPPADRGTGPDGKASRGDGSLAGAVEHAHEHLHWQVPVPRDR